MRIVEPIVRWHRVFELHCPPCTKKAKNVQKTKKKEKVAKANNVRRLDVTAHENSYAYHVKKIACSITATQMIQIYSWIPFSKASNVNLTVHTYGMAGILIFPFVSLLWSRQLDVTKNSAGIMAVHIGSYT